MEPFSLVPRTGLDRVLAELCLGLGDHLVDLCCGRGGIGLWFTSVSGARLTRVDFSPGAIAHARRRADLFVPRPRASFVVADAADTSLPADTADALVCIDALQLVPDPSGLLRETARVLRPGGRAVITTWEQNTGTPAGLPSSFSITDAGALAEAAGLRDSRICPIYEGTNGIQAIDLVMRKVPMRDGGVVGDLLAQMEALGPELAAAGPELAAVRSALADGVRVLREATGWILSRGRAEPNDALAGATPYLRMAGLVVGGWLMARSALAASRLLRDAAAPDAVFLQQKIGTARFYAGQLLPQAAGLLPAVTAGAGPLFHIDLSQASLG